MKYRIKESSGMYYPQVRTCFIFWDNFLDSDDYVVSFMDIESAIKFINTIITHNKLRDEKPKKDVLWYSDDYEIWWRK